jgi:hypothetical protein
MSSGGSTPTPLPPSCAAHASLYCIYSGMAGASRQTPAAAASSSTTAAFHEQPAATAAAAASAATATTATTYARQSPASHAASLAAAVACAALVGCWHGAPVLRLALMTYMLWATGEWVVHRYVRTGGALKGTSSMASSALHCSTTAIAYHRTHALFTPPRSLSNMLTRAPASPSLHQPGLRLPRVEIHTPMLLQAIITTRGRG